MGFPNEYQALLFAGHIACYYDGICINMSCHEHPKNTCVLNAAFPDAVILMYSCQGIPRCDGC